MPSSIRPDVDLASLIGPEEGHRRPDATIAPYECELLDVLDEVRPRSVDAIVEALPDTPQGRLTPPEVTAMLGDLARLGFVEPGIDGTAGAWKRTPEGTAALDEALGPSESDGAFSPNEFQAC